MRKKNSGRLAEGVPNRHTSRFGKDASPAESLDFPAISRGQSCPQHCPYPDGPELGRNVSAIGEPMGIEDVARLLGCSPWTVRQKYLRQGLPYLRASAQGRFIFFRTQVIDWILEQQRKEEWK
jgi:hypothetical protein